MSNNEKVSKRKRASNFSATEEALLMALVRKYCNVIECKKTDALTNKEKDHGWAKLHEEFNCQSGAHPRTLINLKSKYDNMKRGAKKVLMEEKKERFKTGGGTPVLPTLHPNTDILREIMGVGLEGLANPFDSNGTAGQTFECDDLDDSLNSTGELSITDRPTSETAEFMTVDIGLEAEADTPTPRPTSTVSLAENVTFEVLEVVTHPATSRPNDSLSRKDILKDYPKDWSAWSPASLKEKRSEVLISPSVRIEAGSSKAPSAPEGILAVFSKYTWQSELARVARYHSYKHLRNLSRAIKAAQADLVTPTSNGNKKKSPGFATKMGRAATASKLHQMASSKIRVTDVREKLLQAEYEEHKAREDALHELRVESLKLTVESLRLSVAIKKRRLMNLRRAGRNTGRKN